MLLLQQVIDRLGPDAVKTGHEVLDYDQHGQNVTVSVLTDGHTKKLKADALIGADGIRSRLRQRMNPSEGDVHWGGAIMWRGVTPSAHSNWRIVCGDWLSQSTLCVLPHITTGPSNRARRIELDRRDYGREQRRVEQSRLESVGRRGRRACSL